MAGDVRPDSVASTTFRVGMRGYDRDEVRAYLQDLSTSIGELLRQHGAALAKLREYGDRDPAEAVDELTRDLNTILHAAHEAASNLTARAEQEVATMQHAAGSAAQEMLAEAEAAAFAMRKDAWDTSARMLDDVMREVAGTRAQAEKDVLSITGEAERNAHRKLSTAARDAEQQLRNARLEAERMKIEAQAERDELLEQARRSSDAAQERARALEQRRDELLAEIERMREDEAPTPSVRKPDPGRRSNTVRIIDTVGPVSDPDPDYEPDLDEVKVIRPERRSAEAEPDNPFDIDADVLVDEVRRMHEDSSAVVGRRVDPPPRGPADIGDGAANPQPASSRPASLAPDDPPVDERTGADVPEDDVLEDGVAADDVLEDGVLEGGVTAGEGLGEEDAAQVVAPEVPIVADAGVEEPLLAGRGAAHESPEPATTHRPPPDHVVSSTVRLVAPGVVDRRPDAPSATSSEEIGTLFEQLRIGDVDIDGGSGDGGATDGRTAGASTDQVEDAVAEPSLAEVNEELADELIAGSGGPVVGDPFAYRDMVVLPIANRVLRTVKRRLSEVQNVSLEALRVTPDDWAPEPPGMAAAMAPEFLVLQHEAFSAGVTAATGIAGVDEPVLGLRPSGDDLSEPFAAAIGQSLVDAVGKARSAGQDARELSATVSKVYRIWRTDEADRRVRDGAHLAYNQGLAAAFAHLGYEKASIAVNGAGCSECRGQTEAMVVDLHDTDVILPPLHDGCGCTLAPI